MNEFEQLVAWVEKRVIERRATRDEVYALRRLRRADTPSTRGLLALAVMRALMRPLLPALTRVGEIATDTSRRLNEFVMRWTVSVIESCDLGEFDNRAHDWIREEDR